MSGLRFVAAPPPDGRGASHGWAAIASALNERPGEWAVVGEGVVHTLAYQIKTGRIRAFRPAGHFEAVSRRRDDGKYDIYARFVGDADEWDSTIQPATFAGVES